MPTKTKLFSQRLLEENFSFESLTYQMADAHADYYDCLIDDIPHEVKVVKVENEGVGTGYSVYCREEGKEDWHYMDTIEE